MLVCFFRSLENNRASYFYYGIPRVMEVSLMTKLNAPYIISATVSITFITLIKHLFNCGKDLSMKRKGHISWILKSADPCYALERFNVPVMTKKGCMFDFANCSSLLMTIDRKRKEIVLLVTAYTNTTTQHSSLF